VLLTQLPNARNSASSGRRALSLIVQAIVRPERSASFEKTDLSGRTMHSERLALHRKLGSL
jgi:hypothetical protein